MDTYFELREKYIHQNNSLKNKLNWLSTIRLVIALLAFYCMYNYFKVNELYYLIAFLVSALLFIVVVNIHQKNAWQKNFIQQLIAINEAEIAYLSEGKMPFYNGEAYMNHQHFYAYDLDIFGNNSLYQHLNRTTIYIGREKMAELLNKKLPNEEIQQNQQAVKELAEKIGWRKAFTALGKMAADNEQNYQQLITWASTESPQKISKIGLFIAYFLPLCFITSLLVYVFTDINRYYYLASNFFFLNLIISFLYYKKIKNEIIEADNINKIISSYGLMFKAFENEKFQSVKLQRFQQQLTKNGMVVSTQIKRLSTLFASLQTVQNIMGAILFNGAILYHVHTLNSLLKWKKANALNIKNWLAIIGEVEALNSLANFSYNNPAFAFPTLNNDFELNFEALGHPLINPNKRVCNNINFNNNTLMILTGSNMSGKSTFLRTIGINLVLAGIGSAICAKKATVHPLDVLVSMRQTDSLANSESYFLAEVKRLQAIMNQLNQKVCFVLLDEILKGTNSDDKQAGTIAIIKKLVAKKAIGLIATHDLAVCKMVEEYPNNLVNKCFEVAIVNNELVFDYQLQEGVCKNKTATFLMQKMAVI
ncbi:MAG: MutS-related protein [Chitinophagaceae bacterium]